MTGLTQTTEAGFKAWLCALKLDPSWPVDDIVRVQFRGLRGDDDLSLSFAADDFWAAYTRNVTMDALRLGGMSLPEAARKKP